MIAGRSIGAGRGRAVVEGREMNLVGHCTGVAGRRRKAGENVRHTTVGESVRRMMVGAGGRRSWAVEGAGIRSPATGHKTVAVELQYVSKRLMAPRGIC